jgi:hypothetical protein
MVPSLSGSSSLLGLLDPESETPLILLNFRNYTPIITVAHPRTLESSRVSLLIKGS